jgi:hypothetical protein
MINKRASTAQKDLEPDESRGQVGLSEEMFGSLAFFNTFIAFLYTGISGVYYEQDSSYFVRGGSIWDPAMKFHETRVSEVGLGLR